MPIRYTDASRRRRGKYNSFRKAVSLFAGRKLAVGRAVDILHPWILPKFGQHVFISIVQSSTLPSRIFFFFFRVASRILHRRWTWVSQRARDHRNSRDGSLARAHVRSQQAIRTCLSNMEGVLGYSGEFGPPYLGIIYKFSKLSAI